MTKPADFQLEGRPTYTTIGTATGTPSDPATTGIPGTAGTPGIPAPTNVEAALAALQAEIDALPIVTNALTNGTLQTIAASGAAQTLDVTTYNVFDITLTANCTLTISNPPAAGVAREIYIILRQGGSGSYTVTYPASFKWQAADGTATGSAPTLWTAVGAVNVIGASTVDGGTTWGAADEAGGGGAAFATPAIVLGTAAAAGAASTVIRSDSTIVAFDTTVPVTQAFGDAAATGSVAKAARRDHVHGMPTAPSGGEILISDTPAGSPLVFADLLQNESGTDLLYSG